MKEELEKNFEKEVKEEVDGWLSEISKAAEEKDKEVGKIEPQQCDLDDEGCESCGG